MNGPELRITPKCDVGTVRHEHDGRFALPLERVHLELLS